MSAAISHRPEGLPAAAVARRYQGTAKRVQHPLRRLGSDGVAVLTFGTLLLWAFVGSLAMGLRTTATTEPRLAILWLVVTLGIALTGLAAGLLVTARLGE